MSNKQKNCLIYIFIHFFNIVINHNLVYNQTDLYYPSTIDLSINHTKSQFFNESQIVRFHSNDYYFGQLYKDNTLIVYNILQNKQLKFFGNIQSVQYETYQNKTLTDFSFTDYNYSQIHFMTNKGQLITIQTQNLTEINYINFNITFNGEIESKSKESILVNTQQTFYVITPEDNEYDGKFMANINRFQRVDNILNSFTYQYYKKHQNDLFTGYFKLDLNNTNETISNQFNTTFQDNDNRTAEQIMAEQILALTQPMIFQTSIEGKQLRSVVCKNEGYGFQILVLWNKTSYIESYYCNYTDCMKLFNTENVLNESQFVKEYFISQQQWLTNKISFQKGCMQIIVEYDDVKPITFYDINGNQRSKYEINSTISLVYPFYQSPRESAILFQNGSLILFSSSQNPAFFIYQYQLNVTYIQYALFNIDQRSLIINTQQKIISYRYNCPNMTYFIQRGFYKFCSLTCATCQNMYGFCTSCIQGLVLAYGNKSPTQCHIPQPPLPPMTPNNTNNTNNKNQGSINYGCITEEQKILAQFGIIGFTAVGKVISKLFFVIQILPIAWIFIQFLNFWALLSFYTLLQVPNLPQYLNIILGIIYQNINKAVFDSKYLQQILTVKQKLVYLNDKFGISSRFFVMNGQNIIFFTAITLSVIFFILLKTSKFSKIQKRKIVSNIAHKQQSLNLTVRLDQAILIDNNNQHRNILNHKPSTNVNSSNNNILMKILLLINPTDILTNQFISYSSSIVLSISILLKGMDLQSYQDIINVILFLVFLNFIFAFPYLIVSITRKKSTLSAKINLFLLLQWFQNCFINSLVPLLSIVGYPRLFYVGALFIFLLSLWIAWNKQMYRVNQIIIASYKILFHLCFCTLAQLGYLNIYFKHNLGMICVIIISISAIHELTQFFIKLIYYLYRGTRVIGKQLYQSVKIKPNKIQTNDNQNEKISYLVDKTIKNNFQLEKINKKAPTQKVSLNHIPVKNDKLIGIVKRVKKSILLQNKQKLQVNNIPSTQTAQPKNQQKLIKNQQNIQINIIQPNEDKLYKKRKGIIKKNKIVYNFKNQIMKQILTHKQQILSHNQPELQSLSSKRAQSEDQQQQWNIRKKIYRNSQSLQRRYNKNNQYFQQNKLIKSDIEKNRQYIIQKPNLLFKINQSSIIRRNNQFKIKNKGFAQKQ